MLGASFSIAMVAVFMKDKAMTLKYRFVVVTETYYFDKPTEYKYRSYAKRHDAVNHIRRETILGELLRKVVKYIVDKENSGFNVLPQ